MTFRRIRFPFNTTRATKNALLGTGAETEVEATQQKITSFILFYASLRACFGRKEWKLMGTVCDMTESRCPDTNYFPDSTDPNLKPVEGSQPAFPPV